MKRKGWCLFYLVAFLVILTFIGGERSARASELSFYYFNPDSAQANLALLSEEVSSFFRQRQIPIRFQAFIHQVDFEKTLSEQQPALIMVPAWYFQLHAARQNLIHLATPLRNSKTSYIKVLLIRRTSTFNVSELAGKSVAMTNPGPAAEQKLGQYFTGLNFSKSNIVYTPRDADALYALTLGQVDAAVTTRSTVNRFAALSQGNIIDLLKEIQNSSPIAMPVLCTVKENGNNPQIDKVKNILIGGRVEDSLPSFMAMLNINGWQDAKL